MKTLFLKIYGISVKLSTTSDYVFENLEKDFMFFLNTQKDFNESCYITINALKEEAPYWKMPCLEASLYNLGSICYRQKNTHYVDYTGKGLMIYDFKEEKADIYSEDEYLLYEKTKLAILSRTGEILDARHIHRIHAVGFSIYNRITLCLLPMEAGKTTLFLKIFKKDNKMKFISEDVCFLDFKNYVYPFVLRVGSRDKDLIENIPEEYITKIDRKIYGEKYLMDLILFKNRIAEKGKLCNILIGKRVSGDNTEISKVSKVKCFIPFIQSGVFGLGLPQIVELFLRGGFKDGFKKINIIFSRSFVFLLAIYRSNTYEIRIGRNIDNSADKLIRFLNKE